MRTCTQTSTHASRPLCRKHWRADAHLNQHSSFEMLAPVVVGFVLTWRNISARKFLCQEIFSFVFFAKFPFASSSTLSKQHCAEVVGCVSAFPGAFSFSFMFGFLLVWSLCVVFVLACSVFLFLAHIS